MKFVAARSYFANVQASSKRMFPYWIAAAVTALVSVVYARVFGWSEHLAFQWVESDPAWGFVLIPTAMVVSSGLAQLFSPFAVGSGIPQLLAAVEISREAHPLLDKLLSVRMIVVKFLGSCICVAGGGITGREGPMLQISAGIFHFIHKLWYKSDQQTGVVNMQPMILAGGAAGLASAFNTPLGGIIFAIEELAKVHISHIRTFVFHAVIIAGLLSQAIMGNYLYLGKFSLSLPNTTETGLLILASAFIGALGGVFGYVVVALLDWRSKLGAWAKFFMTVICGFAVALFVWLYGRIALGSGRDVIVNLLTHPEVPVSGSLGFVRGVGNLFTYAGGVVGGIFAPALSTGAALGSWFSDFGTGFNHHVWILAGMTAFLTGVTRTPFTSLILVLEMTDSHEVILSLMLAAIVAQAVAKFIDPISFYEHMCHRIIHGKPPTHPAH
jgi:H+/Cl- antiporter ClcA